MIDKKLIDSLTKKLVDDGLLIEAGWVGLKLASIPETAPQVQIDEMRNAFFAGAHHLFSSIMSFLDDGREPTDNDLRRMTQVHEELDRFIKNYKKEFMT
jgi:hypothetical protein